MVNIKALAILSIVLVATVLVSGCCTCCSTDDYLDAASGDAVYESPGDCSDGGDDCLLSELDGANVDSDYA